MIHLLGVNSVFSLLSLNVHSFLLYFGTCYRLYFTQLQLTVFLIYVFLSFVFLWWDFWYNWTLLPFYVSSMSEHCFAFSLSFWCCQVEFCTRLRRICHNVSWNCQKCYMDLSKLLHGFVSASCNVYFSPSWKPKLWTLTEALFLLIELF